MSYEGLGTNGTTSTIRAVTVPEQVTHTEPTEEERAQAEHDRVFTDDRVETAGSALRQNLRFFQPSSYSGDPYAGLALILAAMVALPAVIVGGYVGRKRGAMWKGVAAGVAMPVAVAVVANPLAILATGRRNPLSDAAEAISPADTRVRSLSMALPLAFSAAFGYLGSHLATRDRTVTS